MKRFALLVATIAALVLSSVTSASADQLRGNRFAASTAHTTVAKLATSVSPISTAATLGGSTSGILPATGHRAFYEEVQRQWWQWDGAFVVSKGHPGLDPTGALCGKKQNGAAWFLETGDVATERTCRVPAGRLIYMPVAMVICSPLIGYDLRPNELQACASGEFDALDPANMAPVVVALCADEAQHITGQVFHVWGGAVNALRGWSAGELFAADERWDADALLAELLERFPDGVAPPGMIAGMQAAGGRSLRTR